jgi:hypothetical protein
MSYIDKYRSMVLRYCCNKKGVKTMKGKWKRSIVIVFAIALVISAGVYSSDHFLKATDGEENNLEAPEETGDEPAAVAEEAELPEEDETVMTIEQGYFESDIIAEEIAEANTEEGISGEEITTDTPAEGELQPTAEELEALQAKAEEQKKTANTEKSVKIAYEIVGGEYTGVGSQIELTAVLTGYDGLEPAYQWQYNDGGEWKDIDGATSSVYLLNVTEENSTYNWRVSVTG